MHCVYVWYDIVSVGFTCSATLPGMWERTITVGSAGKTFHATGWKVSCFFLLYGCSKLGQMITMFFALYSHPSLSLSLSLSLSPSLLHPPSLSTCPYHLLSILFPSPLLLFPSLLPPPTHTHRQGGPLPPPTSSSQCTCVSPTSATPTTLPSRRPSQSAWRQRCREWDNPRAT